MAATFFTLAPNDAFSLSFRVVDARIEIAGTIEPGDTNRFVAFLQSLPPKNLGHGYIASLNSPGGSLAEGIQLGNFFRKNGIATEVRRGSQCHSACAVAFLGGTQSYTTGVGVGRTLEVGAALGFHGFYAGTDRVTLLNEAFDAARLINGLIIEYASDMRRIDLALLSELLSVSPSTVRVVNTPRELEGLGIALRGVLPSVPEAWGYNACARDVDLTRPISDGPLEHRISQRSERSRITKIAELKGKLIDDLYPIVGVTREVLAKLPPEELVQMILDVQPKLPAYRFVLQRGAGFYYDHCYAFEEASSSNARSVLVGPGGRSQPRNHGPLGKYPDRAPMW